MKKQPAQTDCSRNNDLKALQSSLKIVIHNSPTAETSQKNNRINYSQAQTN